MSRKKVLMLGPHPDQMGGIASVVNTYMNHWPDHTELKYIYTHRSIDDLIIVKIWFATRAFILFLYNSIFFRYRVLHIHFTWKGSFYRKLPFIFVAKIIGKSVLIHCHASRFKVFYDESSQSGKKLISKTFDIVDGIIALSDSWKKYFSDTILSDKIADKKIYVLGNPVILVDCNPTDVLAIDDRFRLLKMGEIGPRKGTFDLIKAVSILVEKGHKIQLHIGGNGMISEANQLIDELKLQDHIHLLGWVTGEQKDDELRKCHIFLLPSYNEGLPVAILEAASYSKAIVTTPVGGIPDFIVHNKNGKLVPPGDIEGLASEVEDLINNRDLLNDIAINARREVEAEYGIENVLKKLNVIYDQIL
jgi:glycosyltransferase involved in cell wall biosynthesis